MTNPNQQPFRQRLILTIVLLTTVVSGLFSLSIVAIVHQVEENLVSEKMDRALHTLLREKAQFGSLPPLADDQRLYINDEPPFAPIPPIYAELPLGFTELVDGPHAFYAFHQEIKGKLYLLLEEQQEFEQHEQVLYNVVLAGFFLSILAAWGLGWSISRSVIRPLSQLAGQVRQRQLPQPMDGPSPAPLADGYAADEIGALAEALDQSFEELREALQRERLFTSDVSHELRTPLTVILTSCELLQESALTPQQQRQLQQIDQAAREMRHLVQTFLHLARRTPQTDDSELAALPTLVAQQRASWQALADQKGIELQIDIQKSPTTRYPAVLLNSVLNNLLRNALYYTGTGFVRLTASAEGFRVEDSGQGISLAHAPDLFKPFVRGSSTAHPEGLGLGLSLVQRICERQGWAIRARPIAPQGSCFEVTLVTTAASVPSPAPAESAPPRHPSPPGDQR